MFFGYCFFVRFFIFSPGPARHFMRQCTFRCARHPSTLAVCARPVRRRPTLLRHWCCCRVDLVWHAARPEFEIRMAVTKGCATIRCAGGHSAASVAAREFVVTPRTEWRGDAWLPSICRFLCRPAAVIAEAARHQSALHTRPAKARPLLRCHCRLSALWICP